MKENDRKLINRILMGDERSFEKLFDTYQFKVYYICLGFMKNPEDAKDMAQEVFVKVYRKLCEFQFHCSLGTWIYTICASTCLDALQKKGKCIFEEWKESVQENTTEKPEDSLIFDELSEFITGEINKYHDKTMRIMHRRLFANESFEEISTKENMSASSARTYFSRGRRKLAKSVKDFLARS